MKQSMKDIEAWCNMTDVVLQSLKEDPILAEQVIKSGQMEALSASISNAIQRICDSIDKKIENNSIDKETLIHYRQIQEILGRY